MTLISASVCGWIGWWLGDLVGLWTALVLSMVGTGIGLYLGRRYLQV